MKCFLDGSLWHKFFTNHKGDGETLCKLKSLNTIIVLSIVLSMSMDMYSSITLTDEWDMIQPPIQYNPDILPPSWDRLITRHIDYRLWALHTFFHFVNAAFSCDTTMKGRVFGAYTTKVLIGQLTEAWKTNWNEANKRINTKVKWLLYRVYDKLIRSR